MGLCYRNSQKKKKKKGCLDMIFSGRGHLYLKLDVTLVKKIHVIRVVFQDQAMYVRTLFRGTKSCQIRIKG